jgi:eukaryotic-like serine/threonine-protein kinase
VVLARRYHARGPILEEVSSDPARISRYEIVKPIGQGGMGTLYLAWDPKLDRQLAIKVLKGDDPELRERFAREARSAARLRHPHIVTIFDVGDHDGQPFIAMEYIQGVTLSTVIREWKPLTTARKLELMEELCDGLAYAHRAGIVHRDIKPANLIVSAEGQLKILDFGIARLMESAGMTQVGRVVGTLNYMSPEQMTGRAVDSRSDIFAVGVVCYELLSHRQAFPGGLGDGVFHRILNEPPEPLTTHVRGVDAEVVKIVDRALEKDPDRRFQDLATMRTELRKARTRLHAADDSTQLMDLAGSGATVMGAAPTVLSAGATTLGPATPPQAVATPSTSSTPTTPTMVAGTSARPETATGQIVPPWVPSSPPAAETMATPRTTLQPQAIPATKSVTSAPTVRPSRAPLAWIIGIAALLAVVGAIAFFVWRGQTAETTTTTAPPATPPPAASAPPGGGPPLGIDQPAIVAAPPPPPPPPPVTTTSSPPPQQTTPPAEDKAPSRPAPPPSRGTAPETRPAPTKTVLPPPRRAPSPECIKLLERVSLGEKLTDAEQAYLRKQCG